MRKALFIIVLLAASLSLYHYLTRSNTSLSVKKLPAPALPAMDTAFARQQAAEKQKLQSKAATLKTFAAANGFNTTTAFLIDMSLPSGRNRFYIYHLIADTVIAAGLVAHGSCNARFLKQAAFSNIPNTGCSSLGKYKVGYAYNGQFGKAYKLFGLDASNNKAFERFVVLHGYTCVPDEEVDPQPICNSHGCPMVSYGFLKKLEPLIDGAQRPILLWLYQ